MANPNYPHSDPDNIDLNLETSDPLLDTEEIIINPSADQDDSPERDLENRASFLKRLHEHSFRENEINDINKAYDAAKEAHRTQFRDSGERYFEHVRNVALILFDECKVRDPDVIIAALLHDSVEDSPLFGNSNQPFSQWKKVSSERLSNYFNPRVAEMVISLTKPQVDGKEIETKEQAHHIYLENLQKGFTEVLLAKMADRLHNLRTLSGTKPEKQLRILQETKDVYWPIFLKAHDKFPEETKHMLSEMEKELDFIQQGLEKNNP